MTIKHQHLLADLHLVIVNKASKLAVNVDELLADVAPEHQAHVLINALRMYMLSACHGCGLPYEDFKSLCKQMIKTYGIMPDEQP